MTAAVKNVTNVVKSLETLTARADNISNKLQRHLLETTEALDLTDNLADQLGDAGTKLRAALGIHSNFPPQDEPVA